MPRLWLPLLIVSVLTGFCEAADALPDAERIVVIKADGLSFEVVDRLVRQKDPYTGKSLLPWIEHVFYQNGTRLSNFYSRGLSISAPSWAILDTGQHSLIKGNVEFDRLTLDSYDYLNIFSFVLKNSTGRAKDTPAGKLLHEYGVPLFSDAYLPSERHLSIQVVARGLKSVSLAGGLKRLLMLQNPKEWLDEWTVGLEAESLVFEVLERELISKLKNPEIRYLDFLVPLFDHAAHLNREPEAQLQAVQKIDGVVKRIWTAIQGTPLAAKTALILVSDHGMNTDAGVYSQGFNLVDFFGAAAGGGHHVLTHRPPRSAYSFKALSPAVPLVVTSSSESPYLKGQSSGYPTLALDADGNERASVYLRQSDLNLLHILLQQLLRRDLSPELRRAVVRTFFETVDRNRSRWNRLAASLQQELAAARRSPSQSQTEGTRRYEMYIRSLNYLLALRPDTFNASRHRIEDLIPKKNLGESNSIYDLQNYVAGLGPDGLIAGKDGALDVERSFRRLNYFSLLRNVQSRNNVQASISSRPVDFIAVRVPSGRITAALPGDLSPIRDAVWLYKDNETQALILARAGGDSQLELRYVPIRNLTQDKDGGLQFSRAEWHNELPLRLWSDLPLPIERRQEWLEAWHTEKEWLEVFHATEYSNAVIGLHEQFVDLVRGDSLEGMAGTSDNELVARFRKRKRAYVRADFIVFANDHWNFNFRGFNPGGNHGAFFRPSTHSTLMVAGGNQSGIPKGLLIDQPYDALSFAPTVLLLTGRTIGHTPLPGQIIREMFPALESVDK
jgi:hypothetical protein